ncbi:hypothetical protein Lal_00024146 [Lupinus albus]|nr:hypothetical protein Lal_00024146 [Lupinus albus]
MAGRERGASQNVPNDLLVQMVAALQQISENLQHLNRSVAPGPSSHTLVQQGPAEYRGLDKSCRRNPSPFQGGFTPNAAIEWVQGMECTNMKADGVETSESIPHKDFGPHRNFVHGRGNGKMFPEEQEFCLSPAGTRRYTSHGPRTHANVGGSRLNSPSWCNKCNRKHDGGSCFGTTNHCSRCKETGHVKRYCPMSRQSMNAMETGRPQSIGRMVTMYGAGTSGDDDLARGKLHDDRYSLFSVVEFGSDTLPDICVKLSDCGKWCDIYRRFSLLVVIPVRYNFGDGLIMSTRRNKCILIDMGSGVPHSLKFESVIGILNSWKPRLIERFSPK